MVVAELLPSGSVKEDKLRLEVPFAGPASKPGIAGKVVLIASAWNQAAV